jgi:peptide/nickel transport system ATP-binding protein
MTSPAAGAATAKKTGSILKIDDLTMYYKTREGYVKAVEDITIDLERGTALGLVGESGCGKTSVAMTLMGLLPDNGEIMRGSMILDGEELVGLSQEEMRKKRWDEVSMVFQGAMNAWNPVYTVGDQIREAIRYHWDPIPPIPVANERIKELFELVGLNPEMIERYPHEFSGGMRQRAVIAMALSCDPKVIIADEPTTALDVIVQEQILNELKKVQDDLGMSIIYISHDIAVIAEVTERIGVMYAGRLVELGSTVDVFANPRHPYGWLLLRSTPSVRGPRRLLAPLGGEPPNLVDPPSGCRFHPRCPLATAKCETDVPVMEEIEPGHQVACWNWEKTAELEISGVS